MSAKQVALVTGVSSGIGRSVAASLAEHGFSVFGTLRSRAHEPPPGVTPVYVDVRDDAAVHAAVAEVATRGGRIDLVVNNAGVLLGGAIEETDTAQAQALFDVNFFGSVRVTRAVLPHMRAQRSGRILFISSVLGFLPAPFMGFYSASKHALEGYAESLEHETRTLGIRVALIEPGSMRTNADKSATLAEARIADYAEAFERVWASASAHQRDGEDPAVVAKAVLRAATERTPRLRYPVGKGASLLAKLRSFMPAGVFSRSLRRAFRVDA
jgi:NAD(P)-dependent dehydrogenase (short-subunit alcohol dehydrogenase family)